jgi:hypothetical protein
MNKKDNEDEDEDNEKKLDELLELFNVVPCIDSLDPQCDLKIILNCLNRNNITSYLSDRRGIAK